jgi:hypothetical protein
VSNIDSMDRRLTVSTRDVGQAPAAEQQTTVKRESNAAGRGGTLGDLFREKFGDQLKNLTGGGNGES